MPKKFAFTYSKIILSFVTWEIAILVLFIILKLMLIKGLVPSFNGIPNFMGYLMSAPFWKNISSTI